MINLINKFVSQYGDCPVEIVVKERTFNMIVAEVEKNFTITDTTTVNPFTGEVHKKTSLDDYKNFKGKGCLVVTLHTSHGATRIRCEDKT